jgi:ribosomal protein S18 acetylase RimI-like enzyme
MVRIRELTISDYKDMVGLWERSSLLFKPKGRDSSQEIRRQMKDSSDLFMGAFKKRTLVGTAVGSYDGRKGWINRLAVDPRHRGEGIGKLLISCSEKALEKRGARVVCALVDVPNPESVNLFEKLGYTAHRNILYLSKRESIDV